MTKNLISLKLKYSLWSENDCFFDRKSVFKTQIQNKVRGIIWKTNDNQFNKIVNDKTEEKDSPFKRFSKKMYTKHQKTVHIKWKSDFLRKIHNYFNRMIDRIFYY